MVFTSPRPGEKIHEILAQPGRELGRTSHPAIQTWDGPVPSAPTVRRLVALADTPPGTDAEHAAQAVRAAVRAVESEPAAGEVEILGRAGRSSYTSPAIRAAG